MHTAPRLEDRLEDCRPGFVAGIGALAIGVMVYMRAELGKGPTRVGAILIGAIKQQLAEEPVADALLHGDDEHSTRFLACSSPAPTHQGSTRKIKATMEEGKTLQYAWEFDDGRIDFDLLAHAGGQDVPYENGRGQTPGAVSFTTPFSGNQGWFWRKPGHSGCDSHSSNAWRLQGDRSEPIEKHLASP